MAHYAKVVDGIVTEVIVADAEYFNTFTDSSPGEWVETSYNTSKNTHTDGGTALRKNFAGIGDHYDGVGFYKPKPFDSWVFNDTTYVWEPPVSKPDDGQDYYWNEGITGWTLHEGEH